MGVVTGPALCRRGDGHGDGRRFSRAFPFQIFAVRTEPRIFKNMANVSARISALEEVSVQAPAEDPSLLSCNYVWNLEASVLHHTKGDASWVSSMLKAQCGWSIGRGHFQFSGKVLPSNFCIKYEKVCSRCLPELRYRMRREQVVGSEADACISDLY